MYCTLTLIVVIEMWSSSVLRPRLKPTCWFRSAFVRSTVWARQREGLRFSHHCRPHPSPQQGMMGIAVLCARLRNLYDWQPFSSHVLLSLLRTHIGGSLWFKHKDFILVLVFLSNSDWCCLQGHSGSFCCPQHWTLTTGNIPGGVRTNLRTLRGLSGPVREGVPKLGVSMRNAISHWGDAAFPKQLFVYRNPGGTMLLDF